MTPDEIAEWKRESEDAVMEPRVGDIFMDHFTKICRVAARDGRKLMVSKPVSVDADHYVWGKPEEMALARFRTWLSYGTKPGVWCEVVMPRPAINGCSPQEKP